MREFKSNDPVLWKRVEHRFIKSSHDPNMVWITRLGIGGSTDEAIRLVEKNELDLILELPFSNVI